MHVHVVTIFPELFASPLAVGIVKRARDAGLLRVSLVDLRAFTRDRNATTDDAPYGGGPGMVMKVEPIVAALEAIAAGAPHARRVLLSPRGAALDHGRAAALARADDLVLVCGRYEGIDERARAFVDEELSIGDYVLSGGEIAALVVLDAVTRLLPGALGNAASAAGESFATGLLEYPQYTRPESFRGRRVPAVLLSGDHAAIAAWRRAAARDVTARARPDLLTPAAGSPAAAPAPGPEEERE
jgi:tRNA (guanine37-N1)-methyltransferase